MGRETDYYFGRTPETIDPISSGSYSLNTISRIHIENDGYSYLMADIILYDTDGVTVIDPSNYIIYQNSYYTEQEALPGGSDLTIYGDLEITNATYADVDIYISGLSLGAFTTNGQVFPGVDAEFKTVKVNETTDAATDLGAGTIKLNDGGTNLEVSDGSNWLPVGSATETGFNLSNGDMVAGISDYITYDDGAVSAPVDGTGGTPTVIVSLDETTPLVGTQSLLFTKPSTDCQGQGFAKDFTIDEGVRAKTTELKFTYKTSADYVAGDMGMYLYDIDNDVMLLPSVVDVPVADSAEEYFSTFITSDGANYRLIWHVQSTNILSYTMIVDKVEVGEFNQGVGDVGYWETEWSGAETEANPVVNIWGNGKYRLTVDHGAGTDVSIGDTYVDFGNATVNERTLVYIDALDSLDQVFVRWKDDTNEFTADGRGDFASTAQLLKIEKWISARNINTASDFTEYASNSSTTDADDTTSFVYGMGGSEGIIGNTALTAGRKKRVEFKRSIQPTDDIYLELYDPASKVWSSSPIAVGAEPIVLGYVYRDANGGIIISAVDSLTLDVLFFNTPYGLASRQWSAAAYSGVRWRVRKVSNGNMAEVPRMVRAEYGAQVASTAGNSIQFPDVIEDTHSAVTLGTSWKFTAPIEGIYSITFSIKANAVIGIQDIYLYKNGSLNKTVADYYNSNGGTSRNITGSATVRLVASDYIDLKSNQDVLLSTEVTSFWITIERIGN